jgi:hypothetical protein
LPWAARARPGTGTTAHPREKSRVGAAVSCGWVNGYFQETSSLLVKERALPLGGDSFSPRGESQGIFMSIKQHTKHEPSVYEAPDGVLYLIHSNRLKGEAPVSLALEFSWRERLEIMIKGTLDKRVARATLRRLMQRNEF